MCRGEKGGLLFLHEREQPFSPESSPSQHWPAVPRAGHKRRWPRRLGPACSHSSRALGTLYFGACSLAVAGGGSDPPLPPAFLHRLSAGSLVAWLFLHLHGPGSLMSPLPRLKFTFTGACCPRLHLTPTLFQNWRGRAGGASHQSILVPHAVLWRERVALARAASKLPEAVHLGFPLKFRCLPTGIAGLPLWPESQADGLLPLVPDQ